MNERTCGNCRWWVRLAGEKKIGECRRYPAVPVAEHFDLPAHSADWGCGEWADDSITPEQEERRELVRRFAMAIVASGVSMGQAAWDMAEQLVDAEPKP